MNVVSTDAAGKVQGLVRSSVGRYRVLRTPGVRSVASAVRQALMALVNAVAGSELTHFRLRTILYRLAGLDVDLRSRVHPGCKFAGNRVTIGWRSSINAGCYFDTAKARVTLGRRVGVGHGVRFVTTDHETSNPLCRAGATRSLPITINDGAFIGASSTILGGVTIGAGAVVAAGALVKADCLPHSLYAGVPAKLICELPIINPREHPF